MFIPFHENPPKDSRPCSPLTLTACWPVLELSYVAQPGKYTLFPWELWVIILFSMALSSLSSLSDLSNINSFCHSSGGEKSETKVDSAPSEGFREESFFPRFWWLLAVLGILWLWQHPVSVCVFAYLIMRTPVIWFRAHPMGASLVAQTVKNLPAMQRPEFDPWVRKIPWRREWQPTSIVAWRIPWTEEPDGL